MSVLLLFIAACSSKETVKEEEETPKPVELEKLFKQEVKLEIKQLHAWVNLMPGSETRFHISGEILVENNFKYDMNFMILKNIEVFQDNKSIYSVKPLVQIDEALSDMDNYKYVRFSTIKGVLAGGRLDTNKNINLILVFYDGKSEYSYKIENLEIKKTY